MRRLFALIAFIPSCALGSQISDGRPFSLLCVAEQSGGFNWINDHWQQVLFKKATYLLKKVDDANCAPRKITTQSKFGLGKGCYTWAEIGQNSQMASPCDEMWGDKGLMYVDNCGVDNFKVFIKPDTVIFVHILDQGVFEEPTNGVRDSMVLEFGKCSFVN